MNAVQISTRSIRELAFVLTGPVVWAMHLFALYATEGFLCSSASWPDAGAMRQIALAVTAMAVAVLSIFALWQGLRILRAGRGASIHLYSYRKLSIWLATITLLAVTWSALPVILLPACMPEA
jgi:hypothetical protein